MIRSNDIEFVTNIDQLNNIKEMLKREVLNPNLNWQERMDLYQEVQNINQRIKYLINKAPLNS